jgi:hypothetical protein
MEILETLHRTLELVEASSEESPYAQMSAEAVTRRLKRIIESIGSGSHRGPPRRLDLSHLYAPTGPLQELSMANGWSDEYLELAAAIDAYLTNSRSTR